MVSDSMVGPCAAAAAASGSGRPGTVPAVRRAVQPQRRLAVSADVGRTR